MSVQVYSVPGQTEGRRKPFLEWTSIDLSSKRSLTCGANNVDYYKSVHKSCSFSWVSRYVLFLAKFKRRGRPCFVLFCFGFLFFFFGGGVPPPLLLTNKYCRTWSSLINLWIGSRICQKYGILLSARQRLINYLELSKENVLGIWCCHIDHALLESFS